MNSIHFVFNFDFSGCTNDCSADSSSYRSFDGKKCTNNCNSDKVVNLNRTQCVAACVAGLIIKAY